MTVARSEIILDVPKGWRRTVLHPDAFVVLRKIGAIYDRVRWNSVRIYWKSSASTSSSGTISYGIDWNLNDSNLSKVQVQSLSPSESCVVWKDGAHLVLTADRLQPRRWIDLKAQTLGDKSPCAIHTYCDVENGGELWAEYSVTFAGISA